MVCKNKKGWTLVEMVIAMIALAILIGLSIQIIKPKRFMVAPFAYAAIKNLSEGNTYVRQNCYAEKVAGCTSETELPDSKIAQQNLEAMGKTLDDEVHCIQLAHAFTIIGDVHCKWNGGSGDDIYLPKPGQKGKANFQTSNMVSYYFLERPWIEDVVLGRPVENNDETNMQIVDEVDKIKMKEIMIDINGDEKPNKLGEDQFPVRIYINGVVLPSTCTSMSGANGNVDKSPRCTQTDGKEHNYLKTNYPFSYNVVRSFLIDPDNPDATKAEERGTVALRLGISYLEAACRTGRDNYLPRTGICIYDTGGEIEYMDECKSNNKSSFCITRLGRPSSTGLFRLPIF